MLVSNSPDQSIDIFVYIYVYIYIYIYVYIYIYIYVSGLATNLVNARESMVST